jgi:hypothetical protein
MVDIAAAIAGGGGGKGSSKDDNKKWSPLPRNATGFRKGTPFKSGAWDGSQNPIVNVINRYGTIKSLLILFYTVVYMPCCISTPIKVLAHDMESIGARMGLPAAFT